MAHTNPAYASVDQLLRDMGAALQLHAERAGSVSTLAEACGVSRRTLYRLFRGEVVGSDVLIRVLRGLGRQEVVYDLLRRPEATPIERAAPIARGRSPQSVAVEPLIPYLKTAPRPTEDGSGGV